MNVFSCKAYRAFMKAKIRENKGIRGYQSKLADAAGCQRSFLSQVLNSHVHLTPDHAAELAQYWQMNSDESEYFIAMVCFERAQVKSLSESIAQRMRDLREKNTDFGQKFEQPQLGDSTGQIQYYSAWFWSAIHIITSIPKYSSTDAIADRLRLSPELVARVLDELVGLGLVVRREGRWRIGEASLHIPKTSPLTPMNHRNWRDFATRLQEEGQIGGLHYTAIHSVSRKDFESIRDRLFEFIEETRAIVAPSSEEDIIAFCCDLFPV